MQFRGLRAALLLILLGQGALLTGEAAAPSLEKFRKGMAPTGGVQVWALQASKVYHCPKSQWYGRGQGKLMAECEAIKEGYRAAFGQGCGSQCFSSQEPAAH